MCRCPTLGHQMTYGTHLRRSRHGNLCFRYVTPPDVRAVLGTSELSISLGTSSKRGAETAALELQLVAKRVVEHARHAIRMSEPVKSNLAAIHALIRERRFKVLRDELNEADRANAAKDAKIEALTAKLISKFEPYQPEVVRISAPTLSMAVAAYKAEGQSTERWTPKTADAIDGRLCLLIDWFGDVPISTLSREGMTSFMEALTRLPKHAGSHRALKSLSLRELIALNGVEHQ